MFRPRWLACSLLIASPLLASWTHAKSPPSAFGEAFDQGSTTDPRHDVDDAAPDGGAHDRRPAKLQKVRRPNPGRRQKTTLDGSQGARDRDDDEEDAMP